VERIFFVKPILQMKENRKKERRKIGEKEGRREGEKQRRRETEKERNRKKERRREKSFIFPFS
jgi:hypothetical protein